MLPIDHSIGFHPSLKDMAKTFQDGELAILQGVGYPNPNRSHFRSIEIWESASKSNEYLENGWITEVFIKNHVQIELDGIVMGKNSLGPMFGNELKTLDINNPDKFIKSSKYLKKSTNNRTNNKALAYLLNVQKEINDLRNMFAKKLISTKKFSPDSFSKALYQSSRIILSDISVPVIKISLGSFYTHSN